MVPPAPTPGTASGYRFCKAAADKGGILTWNFLLISEYVII